MPYLLILPERGAASIHPIGPDAVVLGRKALPGVGLAIADSRISRAHARISPDPGGGWKIEDLGSKNGVLVNGQRIASDRQLQNGEIVQIGETRVAYHESLPESTVLSTLGEPGSGPTGSPAIMRSGVGTARVHLLADLARELTHPRPMADLLTQLVERPTTALAAARGLLALRDSQGVMRVAASAEGTDNNQSERIEARWKIGTPLELSRGIVSRVIHHGQAVLFLDAAEELSTPSVTAIDLRSVVTAPLRIDGEVQGLLYVEHPHVARAFSNDDLSFLEAFAALAGAALEVVHAREALEESQRSLVLEREQVITRGNLVAVSAAMRSLLLMADRLAQVDTTVLIEGESGTGKEELAQVLHSSGPRATGPFVAVNCAAVPDTRFEAEFFGWDKGAFTDAHSPHPGWIEEAHGGTLLLDEIGDLPLPLQAKLLRVLQDQRVTRIGSTRTRDVDLRVVATTNRDLAIEVRAGRFREDLFYRLRVVPICMPPLRERPEDIPVLVKVLLDRLSEQRGVPRGRVSQEVMGILVAHPWHGNVRELLHTLERMAVCSNSTLFEVSDLPEEIRRAKSTGVAPAASIEALAKAVVATAKQLSDRPILECFLPHLAQAAVNHEGGKRQAARALGMAPTTLYRLLARIE